MWRKRSFLDDTVGSSPKPQAPWRRSDFAIGGCAAYSALPGTVKSVPCLSMLCPGLAPPDLRSLYIGILCLMQITPTCTCNCNAPPYSALSSSLQFSGDFRKSRWGRVFFFFFLCSIYMYVVDSVYMPYQTLAPHKSFPRPRIHP